MRYVLLEEGKDVPWKRYLKNEGSIAVGAMDGDKIAAYAVYSTNFNNPDYIYLDYIYTVNGYREQYVASDLLEYMELIWKNEGFKYVLARIIEEDAKESAAYKLMNSIYFTPLQETAKIFIYKLCEIKINDRIQKLLKLCDKNTGVVHISSRKNREYVQFADRLKKRGTDIDNVSFDTDISCFYRGNDGRIYGCALIDKYGEGIVVKYIYINSRDDKYALLYMVCEMLKSLNSCKKDAQVSIILSGKNYIDFFMYFFPEYLKSYDMWDYILEL